MIVSTRGRYALRVLIDLAENGKDGFIPMKTIARRQGISLKYLEQILPALTRQHLVEGIQGKGGGYRLCRRPEEYKVSEVLQLTEGGFAPVSCLKCDAEPCDRTDTCPTRPMWEGLESLITDYFDNITLADLMKRA